MTTQTVLGDLETGMFGAEMVSMLEGRLMLIGGKDGNRAGKRNDHVYEYSEEYGFFDTGTHLKTQRFDTVVVAVKKKKEEAP